MTPPQTVADAFGRYRRRVESVAVRILKDREEASDVASETFLAMLERGPSDERATLSWLLACARNRALNRARDRARAGRRVVAAIDPDRIDAGDISVEQGALQAAELVRRASERLGDRDRLALRLRYIEDRNVDDVATALRMTSPQVRVVLHRASKRLRRETVVLLSEMHDVPEDCMRFLMAGSMNGGVHGHDGCSPCTRVMDEITAMTARGLAPVMPALGRLASIARRVARPHRTAAATRIVEAAAAIAFSAALAVQAPVTAAVGGAVPTGDLLMARGSTSRTAAASRVASFAHGRAHAVRGLEATDAAGDSQTLAIIPPLTQIGIPLSVPDALSSQPDPGIDIRKLLIDTVTDAKGHRGVRFRIGLAGPAARNGGYDFTWLVGRGCNGSLTIHTPNGTANGETGTYSISCPSNGPVLDFRGNDDSYASGDLLVGVIPNGVEAVMLFKDLPKAMQKVMAPGAQMKAIVASSYKTNLSMDEDHAPDKGDGATYKIQR